MKGQGQGEIYFQSLYSGFPMGALSLEEEGTSCLPGGENSRLPCPQSPFIDGLINSETELEFWPPRERNPVS